MNIPLLHPSPFRLPIHGLLLVAALALGLPAAVRSQSTLANNNMQEADFQGKDIVHTWTVDLPEDFNDFRLQVQSPTGIVKVFVIPVDRKRAIDLNAIPKKGQGSALVGMRGDDIDVSSERKLAKGRYTILINPYKHASVGKYSVRIVEPKLAEETPKADGASSPPPAPAPAPTADASNNSNADLLSEIRKLREQMAKMEQRLSAIEAAQKQK